MKIAAIIALLIVACGAAQAQTNTPDVNDVFNAVQQFAQDNLDDDVLKALQDVDRQKVQDFLNHYQDYLQGDYVLDMAQLKDASKSILPLLDAHEETRPYAAWLRARMDYFDAADELQTNIPPVATEPQKPLPRPSNPSFRTEQKLWTNKVAKRPLPKGAAEIVPKMKAIFANERVPEELVWLAEVESGFNSQAESPVGAAGMFQLMPTTAKEMGLSLWPEDQRYQSEAEAQAAAKYLRILYKQFGDWRLAVAAYNCGSGTLQKKMERARARSYASVATHLPAETQMYVPKVEATILHREGLELEKLKAPADL